MKIIIVFLLMLLAGCGGMTNDEIIAETKKCEAAGMEATVLMNGFSSRIKAIQCEPKKVGR